MCLGIPGEVVSFLPGQAVDMFLVNPPHPDPRGPQHPFSIAGTGGHDTIQIATRIRESVWKKNLLEMPLGAKVEIEGPWGEFVLPKEPGDVVMLAGGIGVTPFRAMAEDASARSLLHDLALIHSNRTPEETPFLAQLKRWMLLSSSWPERRVWGPGSLSGKSSGSIGTCRTISWPRSRAFATQSCTSAA